MRTGDKKSKKQSLTRRGVSKLTRGGPFPKRYIVEVELGSDGKSTRITRRAENMTAWELYGLLRVLMLEIEDRIRFKPDDELKME